MAALKKITIVWYKKVAAILKADTGLAKKLGKPTVAVCTPDQKHEDFPKEVTDVTEAIHAAGMDVYTMSKKQIADIAINMLVLGNPPPPPVAVPEPEPEPEIKPPNRSIKPAAPARPVAADKPKKQPPKPAVKPKPEPEAEEPGPEPDLDVEDAAPEKAASVARKIVGDDDEDEEVPEPVKPTPKVARKPVLKPAANNGSIKAPPEYVRANVPFILGCAILSNFQAAATLLEPYADKDPEAREVLDKLNQLIDSVHQKTVLPGA